MGDEIRKKNLTKDIDVRVAHHNKLWFLYRALSEDVIMAEETKNVLHSTLNALFESENKWRL